MPRNQSRQEADDLLFSKHPSGTIARPAPKWLRVPGRILAAATQFPVHEALRLELLRARVESLIFVEQRAG